MILNKITSNEYQTIVLCTCHITDATTDQKNSLNRNPGDTLTHDRVRWLII